MFYVRGKYWVVVDKIATDRPRKIETLWHWHPLCRTNISGKQIVTGQNDGGFLHVIPVSPANPTISMIKGQETPFIQGWYSKAYNSYTPNTVSIYATDIQKETAFVWLLYPSKIQNTTIEAKILSENKDGLILQVTHPIEGQWTLTIPYTNSNKASIVSVGASYAP